jgi:hypothetical protein
MSQTLSQGGTCVVEQLSIVRAHARVIVMVSMFPALRAHAVAGQVAEGLGWII